MVGIPGSGKSFFAEHFAKTFSAPLISFSKILEVTDDKKHAAKITDMILDELTKTEKTFIYEGPTDTAKLRDIFIKKVTKSGYTPLIIWVQTESVEAKRRATHKVRGTKTLSPEQFENTIKTFEPPRNAVVISGKHTYASQLKIVLKHIAGSAGNRGAKQIRVTDAPVRSTRQTPPR